MHFEKNRWHLYPSFGLLFCLQRVIVVVTIWLLLWGRPGCCSVLLTQGLQGHHTSVFTLYNPNQSVNQSLYQCLHLLLIIQLACQHKIMSRYVVTRIQFVKVILPKDGDFMKMKRGLRFTKEF